MLKGNTTNFKKRSFEIYIIKKTKQKKFYNSIPFPLSEKSVYNKLSKTALFNDRTFFMESGHKLLFDVTESKSFYLHIKATKI